jgi:hypothetical protein
MAKARHAVVLATLAAAWVGMSLPAPLAHANGHRSHRSPSNAFFTATTAASAFHVSFTQAPATSIITGSLINDDAGYATGGFDTGGNSEAAAAALYPGSLVAGGPGLLCTELFSCPFSPPNYPLLADASYPRQPKAHVASSKPTGLGNVLQVTPSFATAHAGATGNRSTTRTGRVSLLGMTPFGLSFGASRSSNRVATHGARMTVRVDARVSDIKVGPLLHIGSVRTTDRMTLTRGRHPVDRPKVRISGVTIAGKSATITGHGVEVDGHPLGSVLSTKLVRSGVQVRSLGVARTDHAKSARSSAGGLEINFALPVKNAPYIPNPAAGLPGLDQIPGVDLKGTYLGVMRIGGAGAAAAIAEQPGAVKLPPVTTNGHNRRPRVASGTHNVGGVQRSGLGRSGSSPQAPAPVVAADPANKPSAYFVGLSRDDLLTLYLVIALGTAGIFLGWRGTVAAKRRRLSTAGRGR